VIRRRLALLTVALAATLPAWATAAVADLTPSPTPTSSSGTSALPVLVTLAGVSPLAPQPGDDLTVRGTLTDQAATPVSNLTVALLVSRTKIGSRGAFQEFAATPDGPPPSDASAPTSQSAVLARTELDTGESERFSVTVPVDDLALPQAWQVYEMTVVVSGDTVTGHVTARQLRTFLPWAPVGVPGVGQPTRLAWVWPIVDRPHRSDSTSWTDDSLASSLAAGGRLERLVAAGARAEAQTAPPPPKPPKKRGKHPVKTAPARPAPTITPVPVTWAIDPQLVDDADAMRRAYTVRAADGPRPGRGAKAATQWLGALHSAVARSDAGIFGVPYGDPDVVAASDAGLGNLVQKANALGDFVLQRQLGRAPLPYAWPPNGLLDQRALETLIAGGKSTMVLDSGAMPIVGGPPSVTPSAHAMIKARDEVPVQALLADHTLNEVVDAGAHSASAGPLAIQRLLSELLMIQAELPATPRSLVITPSRRWAPTPSYAAAILADTGRVPWIAPVSLSQVVSDPVYDAVQRPRLTFPTEDRSLLLSRGYLDRVSKLRRLVDTFASVVVSPADPLVRSFDDGLLRLLSSAWRSDPSTARSLRESLLGTVQDTMGKVHIAARADSLVTLTSHSGNVPVTVTNDLDTPVAVVVEVEPDQHLVVKRARVEQTVAAHRQVPIDVRASAQTSGVFRLTVRLATKSGRPYGEAVPLRVRSTAYGWTALLITGGATAVLLMTVVVRLLRRARAARRTAPIAT
jgi:hypothetical protein